MQPFTEYLGGNPILVASWATVWGAAAVAGWYAVRGKSAVRAGQTYEIKSAPGLPFFRQYMVAKADGLLMEAYAHLGAGAQLQSSLCTAALAVSRIRGEALGHGPDPSAVTQPERAALRGFGATELATLLLEGEFLWRDIPRAVFLLEREEPDEDSVWAALELAALFCKGELVTRELPRAARYLLPFAPTWRRAAACLDCSQVRWMLGVVMERAGSRARVGAMPGWQLQRLAQQSVSVLRGGR